MLLAALLLACSTDSGSTASVATTTGSVTDAACATQANALRFDCTVTLADAGALSWTVRDGDEAVRTFTTDEDTDHAAALWGLAPERTYSWEAVADEGTASGTVTTGALPDALASADLQVSGDAPAVDALLIPASCDGFTGLAMVAPSGELVWYEELESTGAGGPLSGVTGFDWSAGGTAVVSVDGSRLLELDPSGAVLRETSGFARPLHHDVSVVGDRLLALNAAEHDGAVVDGFYVVGPDGSIEAEWDLADHADVAAGTTSDAFWRDTFPGASDWSHGNSISAYDDGTALLSFRWLDAVVEVVADPDAPDFGAIDWVLTGTDGGSLQGDFTWIDGGGFVGQHHASWTPDGRLSLFDNGTTSSRALVLDVDLDAGTAAESEAHGLGQSCQIQGATYALDDGSVIATCADAGEVVAFAPGGGETWSMRWSCGGTRQAGMSRALPVHWM